MVQRIWQVVILLVLLTACTQQGAVQPADDMDNAMEDVGETMDDMAKDRMVDETMEESMDDMQETMDGVTEGPDKTFVLAGENFRFLMGGNEAPDLRVNVGDRVRIEFSSNQGFHDWAVDGFDAKTDRVRPEDGVTVVEFTADQAGTFEYYCSVGSHRANGMVGSFIVS